LTEIAVAVGLPEPIAPPSALPEPLSHENAYDGRSEHPDARSAAADLSHTRQKRRAASEAIREHATDYLEGEPIEQVAYIDGREPDAEVKARPDRDFGCANVRWSLLRSRKPVHLSHSSISSLKLSYKTVEGSAVST